MTSWEWQPFLGHWIELPESGKLPGGDLVIPQPNVGIAAQKNA
jgi:hypothetical protein